MARTTALTRTRKEIEAAWHSFVADGRLPESLRPEIRRSWRRVRAGWQVDPRLRTCPRATRAEDALARAESDGAFHVASRVVSHFADRLKSGGHVVAYFDADGVMLALDGNARTRSRLADVNFAPGACWAEKAAGTNGPGTALVEARPVEVFASEHFVEAWQPWTCASVPVRFGRRVIGAVDITSPWTAREPSLLLTAEALGRAIESQLEAEAERMRSTILLQVAEDALRARDDFLAVASHELKTPLTPLRIAIQKVQRLLGPAGGSVDRGEVASVLRRADGHVGRLVEAIDGLLHASRAAQEPLRPALEPCEVGGAVRRVVERRRADFDRRRCDVTVTVRTKVIAQCDPDLVERAFEHLVGNAAKYAPGRIEVEVDADRTWARLRVRDHGPGIAPEHQERIFHPYERAVSCTNEAGFGLGLHMVRRVAEAHGGTARVESGLGRGSTFTLQLPLDRERSLGDDVASS